MARLTKPLTSTGVRHAKPKEKEYNLMDGSGLKLRVKPNGVKSWLFNYTDPTTNKRNNLSLGSFPAVSLEQARKECQRCRELIAEGQNPKHARDQAHMKAEQAARNTFSHVAHQWFAIKKSQVTEDYATDIWRSLEKHVLRNIGNTPISSVSAPQAIEILKPIAARGNLETVRRLIQRINEVMNYAVNAGLLEANKLSGIKAAFQAPVKKNMPALPPSQLPLLLERLDRASIKITTRCVIKWQLHTMTRPGEAALTQWEHIDLDNAVWTIPAEIMKRKHAHKIPLTSQAISILKRMKPISGHRDYVFPSDKSPRTHIDKQTANMALKRMGFGQTLVAHGLRSIASTALYEHGFESELIESALAHKDKNQVRAAYNRAEYVERRRTMLEWWSQTIEKARQNTNNYE